MIEPHERPAKNGNVNNKANQDEHTILLRVHTSYLKSKRLYNETYGNVLNLHQQLENAIVEHGIIKK